MVYIPPRKDRTGETSTSTYGQPMTIVSYRRDTDLDVEFADGTIITNKSYYNFKKGDVYNPNYFKSKRTGETNVSKQGCKMTVVNYHSSVDIDIMFDDGTVLKHKEYASFKSGEVSNPNHVSAFGVGYLGIGKFSGSHDKNDPRFKMYNTWRGMLERCYSNRDGIGETYRECVVCEEWHNFQNFASWYVDNYIEYGIGCMCLDKDILKKNNKVYSPDTCIFVDNRINCLFTKTNKNRGLYPIGVFYQKKNKKFVAQCSMCDGETKKQQKHIGLFSSPNDAFLAYKDFKEKYIKQIADYYNNTYSNFPQKLHDALYSYEVDIND